MTKASTLSHVICSPGMAASDKNFNFAISFANFPAVTVISLSHVINHNMQWKLSQKPNCHQYFVEDEEASHIRVTNRSYDDDEDSCSSFPPGMSL